MRVILCVLFSFFFLFRLCVFVFVRHKFCARKHRNETLHHILGCATCEKQTEAQQTKQKKTKNKNKNKKPYVCNTETLTRLWAVREDSSHARTKSGWSPAHITETLSRLWGWGVGMHSSRPDTVDARAIKLRFQLPSPCSHCRYFVLALQAPSLSPPVTFIGVSERRVNTEPSTARHSPRAQIILCCFSS